jgi:hypothetical protein
VGTSAIAAAHGTTLNENASAIYFIPGATLNFGSLGEDDVVVWDASGVSPASPLFINVVAGTLKAANNSLNNMINRSGR